MNTFRSRVALFALMGAFLIPLGISSMRGLTHVLTCKADARTPFTIIVPSEGPPQIQSSARIRPGEKGLCGGLTLDPRVGAAGTGHVRMIVAITNNTDLTWRGTVEIVLAGQSAFPVDIGEIPPHESASDELVLRLETGSHQLDGSLLIGP